MTNEPGVTCGHCNTGELFLFTTEQGTPVQHPTRTGFFKTYCDSCGRIGGIDRDANPDVFAAMSLGKIETKMRFIIDPVWNTPTMRAAMTRRLNRAAREE